MTDAEILVDFMQVILFVNLFIVGYLLTALFYIYKALRFLRSTAKSMIEHDDNADEIYDVEIPAIHEAKPMMRFEIFMALLIYGVNLITNAYVTIPDAQLLDSWIIITCISSFGTAYILLSAINIIKMKQNIDVICAPYNITLNAYKFIDDANKEKKNDSTD